MAEYVISCKGLSYYFDEAALPPYGYKGGAVMPLLSPVSGLLIGFLLNKNGGTNFTYNDLFKLFLGARRSGLKVDASDEKGILDETYEREEAGDGYTFYWLPSFLETA
jgi:hypothetical protein